MHKVVVTSVVLLLTACSSAKKGRTLDSGAGKDSTALRADARLVATPPVKKLSPQARTEEEQNSIDVFRSVAPATVFVTQVHVIANRFSLRATEVPAGTGTGFIWDQEGHVVTNLHVVAGRGRPKLQVTLYDRKTYSAKLVGYDQNKDIAVLKINAPAASLTPVRQTPPGYTLEVGQKTIAIGNPFGLDHTVTTGIISAFGREVRGFSGVTIRDMVQTDAAINPGNSGGPLLDSQGQLIGMNTMIFSKSGSSAGIGFAVPHIFIQRVVPQIIKNGRPVRVGIGILLLHDDIARRHGIKGVVIQSVESAAARQAGFRGLRHGPSRVELGDIIVKVDKYTISSYDDLYNALDRFRPGDIVAVTVQRDGNSLTLKTELIVVN